MKSLKQKQKVKISNILISNDNISKLNNINMSLSSFLDELLSRITVEDINNIKGGFRNDETTNKKRAD